MVERICIDYHTLPQKTIKDKFSIPIIDELYGVKAFVKLDLRFGYHRIRIKDSDIKNTAFRTNKKHCEFLVMPIYFSRPYEQHIQAIFENIFLVFYKDIITYNSNFS